MEALARVYAESLFGVAKDKGDLDVVRDQLNQLVDALESSKDLEVFFFSPYFSSQEKLDGLQRAVEGANPEFLNFLELLIEKHRMPAIYRIAREYEDLWKTENQRLDVTLTRRRGRASDRPRGHTDQPRRREDHRRHRASGREHGSRQQHSQ